MTHIWWRQASYHDAPKTLAEYGEKTLQAYRNATEKELQPMLDRLYTPRNADDERRYVHRAYVLSGGDSDQFGQWYETWVKQQQTFQDRFRDDFDKRLLMEARWQADGRGEFTAEHEAQIKLLEELTKAYVLDAYRAEKPLDPVALRARAA
jgi:hypothetical protein